ncbi:rCG40283 [Rattus norvegicus]|uniref:RCG40283 n=1 Tax=Rattus norvegicus TaxID=10116 RepID=A6I8F6_RAT|nr:rCG40283 [Rattus norvegicus]
MDSELLCGNNQQAGSCPLGQETRILASSRTSPALPGAIDTEMKDSLPVSIAT